MQEPNEKHFDEYLKRSRVRDYQWGSKKLLDWWAGLFIEQPREQVLAGLGRELLKMMCESSKYNDKEVLTAILSWGGMKGRNRSYLKKGNIKEILKIISELRKEKITSLEAYTRFYDLHRHKQMPGMRQAYYTKLIFFCSPKHDGYIMDQWTAKSINLIFGDIVKLDGSYVSDKNDVSVYKEFCMAIRLLSKRTGCDPEATEMRLFSHGGSTKGDWRKYVDDEFQKNKE